MDGPLERVPRCSPAVEATVEDDEPTARVVVMAVAATSDEPVMELPSLYESIDPDVLDALFPESATDGSIAFSYNDFLVVVTATDTVQVYDEASS